MLATLFAITVASAPITPLSRGIATASFAPGYYSMEEVAKSVAGSDDLTCASSLKGRLVALSLRERSVAETRALLAKHLDLVFSPDKGGAIVMEEASAPAAKRRRALTSFARTYESQLGALAKEAITEIINREQVVRGEARRSTAAQVQDQRPASMFAKLLASPPQVAAVSLADLSSLDLRSLIKSPAARSLDWNRFALDASVAGWIRSAYEPDWESVLKPPHYPEGAPANEENRRRYRQGWVFLQRMAFDPLTLTLIINDGPVPLDGTGFLSRTVRPPRPPEELFFETRPGDASMAITRAFLLGPDSAVPIDPPSRPSVSGTLLKWSIAAKRELIACVSPVRDHLTSNGTSLRRAYWPQWLLASETPGESPPRLDTWSSSPYWLALEKDGNVLVGRNALAFIDNSYECAPPLRQLLTQPLATKPRQGDLEALLAVARELPPEKIGELAQCRYPLVVSGCETAVPFLRALAALPVKEKELVVAEVKRGKEATFRVDALASKDRTALLRDMSAVARRLPLDGQRFFGLNLLRPDLIEEARHLTVRISPSLNTDSMSVEFSLDMRKEGVSTHIAEATLQGVPNP